MKVRKQANKVHQVQTTMPIGTVHHKKKGHEYLVSWVGYGTEGDSWLSVKDLELCPGMVRAFWREAQAGERPPKGALP